MWTSTNTFSSCDPTPPPEEKQSSPIACTSVAEMEIRQLIWLKNLSLIIVLDFQTNQEVPNTAHHKTKHVAEQSPQYEKREMELLSSAAVSTKCNYNLDEKKPQLFYVTNISSFLLNLMTLPQAKNWVDHK